MSQRDHDLVCLPTFQNGITLYYCGLLVHNSYLAGLDFLGGFLLGVDFLVFGKANVFAAKSFDTI